MPIAAENRPRALVVEDDQNIRDTVREIMENDGWRVTATADGEAGLATARAVVPDLIVSDIMMPGRDGLSLLAELRADEHLMHVPVIFLTARVEAADLRLGMERGADDYLVKPFDPEELLRAARTRLARRRAIEAGWEHFREEVARMLPHELRTPLVGVLGFADLLLEEARQASGAGTVPAPVVQECAQQIRLSGQRLLRLVERYVLWVELATGVNSWRPAPAGSGRVLPVNLAADQAREVARRHRRESDLLLTLPPAEINGPVELFARVVAELVDNACKFSPPGTIIAVAGQEREGFYHLTVRDEGRGLPEGAAHRIGAFVQFDRQHWEQQGTGLGLAIAARYAQLVGGRLVLQPPAAGPGTVAELVVPVCSPARNC